MPHTSRIRLRLHPGYPILWLKKELIIADGVGRAKERKRRARQQNLTSAETCRARHYRSFARPSTARTQAQLTPIPYKASINSVRSAFSSFVSCNCSTKLKNSTVSAKVNKRPSCR